jgi:cell division GTPase FtsZ
MDDHIINNMGGDNTGQEEAVQPEAPKVNIGLNIPNIPLEDFVIPENIIKSELGLENEYSGSLQYGVLGCGQAGGRIAKSFYDQGYKKCLAVNTAKQDLNPLDLPEEQKLKIGDAEGSGKDMNKGNKAASDSYQRILDRIKSTFGTVDKIIICVGFGGGTGAGSLNVLIKIAQSYLEMLGNKNFLTDVIVIAALPTSGEKKSKTISTNLILVKDRIKEMVDQGQVGPLFIIDNSKIEAMYRGISPVMFWKTVNDTITGLFQTFNYLATQESDYTSFDSEDYKAVLSAPGYAVVGVTKVDTKASDMSIALQENFKKTILASGMKYDTARQAGCILAVNNGDLATIKMDDLNYAYDAFNTLVGGADVHRGLYGTDAEGTRAYTLVTGLKTNE